MGPEPEAVGVACHRHMVMVDVDEYYLCCTIRRGSERRSTARQIQSKSTEFVCPSFSQKEQNSSGRRSLDGQTDSVKKYRIRLAVVCPSAVWPSSMVHCPLLPERRFTTDSTTYLSTLSMETGWRQPRDEEEENIT